ncbi:MAG: phosphatidylglycerol lysyltransferase domain-containing protein [Candidatus Poribacteria bacterium]|nr:phosphatidylglycerol lysyltransferase domain-containing protein [Candidatus Poribacteria bacterium]
MQLRPLTLEDKPVFEAYASQMCTHLSSYAFAPLYVWRNHFQFYWTLLDEHFCIFAKQDDDYFMPILPIPCAIGNCAYLKIVRDAYQFMLESNQNSQIARIENVPEELLSVFKNAGFHAIQKETEYVYRSEDLSELRGNRYKQQRNAYNAFGTQYPLVKCEPYLSTDRDACLNLYETWRKSRAEKYEDPIYHAMLDDSQSAHQIGITHAKELGLVGRVVRFDDDLRAYTFGYELNSETFCVLFEISDLNIKGLSQFIYREFCKELMATYKWINAMDDSGLENLKRVKRSYHPTRLIPSYNIYDNSIDLP